MFYDRNFLRRRSIRGETSGGVCDEFLQRRLMHTLFTEVFSGIAAKSINCSFFELIFITFVFDNFLSFVRLLTFPVHFFATEERTTLSSR